MAKRPDILLLMHSLKSVLIGLSQNWLARFQKFFFILGLDKLLAYLECIRSYAWSFGNSDPDLSSVFSHYGSPKEHAYELPLRSLAINVKFILVGDPSTKIYLSFLCSCTKFVQLRRPFLK